MKPIKFIGCAALLILMGCKTDTAPRTLTQVLSHNDYEQPRPLFDALDAKINIMEVDLALKNDTLYVTHAFDEIEVGKTFESLYLNPLQNIITENGGFVYTDDEPFVLYINMKTSGETAEKINTVLSKYDTIISSFTKSEHSQKPVYVICGRPDTTFKGIRYMVAEGDLETSSDYTAHEFYMVNLKWGKYFSWTGEGTMPEDEQKLLQKLVKDAHQQGRILRFWNNPDIVSAHGENFWKTVLDLGVDVLSTDAPKEIGVFFTKN